jgi:hypothetical protein
VKLQDLVNKVVRIKEVTPGYLVLEDITRGEGSYLNPLLAVECSDDTELEYYSLKPETIKP